MPNRILKESIRTSDSINGLGWFEEVLFYRLMVSCDDYGRFDGRIAIIKGACFPLKSITNKDIEKALGKLVAVGLVGHYEVEEKPYLQLSAWERHQNIRAKKSKYPCADDGKMIAHENICMHMQSNVPDIQSNPNPNPNPNLNPDTNLSTKYFTDNRTLDNALREYISFRTQIKKPMTEKAVELAIKKLNKLTKNQEEQIAIIEQSILNGWQGLFPLKEDKKVSKDKVSEVDNW